MKMKTFFKRVLILGLIYVCYWVYTWNMDFYWLLGKINYLGDMSSSYSDMSNSRFDAVNK